MQDKNNIMIPQRRTIYFRDDGKCIACGGTGYQYERDEEGREYAIDCPACNGGHDETVRRLKEASKIPVRYGEKSIADIPVIYEDEEGRCKDATAQRDYLSQYIKTFEDQYKEGRGLYLWSGTRGTGKTLSMACVANEIIKRYEKSVFWIRSIDILDYVTERQESALGRYDRDPIKRMYDCDLLMIDDLGQNLCGENFLNETLLKVIDKRYTNRLPTFYSSNLKVEDLKLPIEIQDRIVEVTAQVHFPECPVRKMMSKAWKQEFASKARNRSV